jgi:hypothetical protein
MQATIRRRRFAVAAAVGALALLSSAPAEAEREPSDDARPSKIVKTRKIAPGLKYTRSSSASIPRRTFILTIDPSKARHVDAARRAHRPRAASCRGSSTRTTRSPGSTATTAAVPVGNPVPDDIDGELLHTAAVGTLFAISADGNQVLFGSRGPRHDDEPDLGRVFPRSTAGTEARRCPASSPGTHRSEGR